MQSPADTSYAIAATINATIANLATGVILIAIASCVIIAVAVYVAEYREQRRYRDTYRFHYFNRSK